MPKIFISYRREDSEDITGRIHDHLSPHFGRDNVFMDVDTIPLGVDFREHLRRAVEQCDILLAVIGEAWLSASYKSRSHAGQRRLDDPGDFVRIEIESALARNIPVIPVLVDKATMPGESELPQGQLRTLPYRNIAEVRAGKDFHDHVNRLIRGIDRLAADLGRQRETEAAQGPARQPERRAQPSEAVEQTRQHGTPAERATTPADFARCRDQLGAVLKRLEEAFRRLGAAERADVLLKASQTLHDDAFRVMVVGEFKRGKTTLLNALLGQMVLPYRYFPYKVAIRIRYGERRQAVLLFNDGRPSLEVSLEGSADELKKFIRIQDDGEGEEDPSGEAVNRSPYKMAVVVYPLPLCRNGVEFEEATAAFLTKAQLAETDAMVMVLACEQALSSSERQFIDAVHQTRSLRDVFFLWNHFDAIQDSPQDEADIRKLSRDKLEQKIGAPGRVFFVSSRDALQGRRNNQPALLARSNVPQFEAALERFLSTERGQVKLRNAFRQAEAAVREGRSIVQERLEEGRVGERELRKGFQHLELIGIREELITQSKLLESLKTEIDGA